MERTEYLGDYRRERKLSLYCVLEVFDRKGFMQLERESKKRLFMLHIV